MKCHRLKPYQYIFKSYIKNHGGTSLVVQWLKLLAPSAGDLVRKLKFHMQLKILSPPNT